MARKRQRHRRRQRGTSNVTARHDNAAQSTTNSLTCVKCLREERTTSVAVLECAHTLCHACYNVLSEDPQTFRCPACPQKSPSTCVNFFINKVKNVFLSSHLTASGGPKCSLHGDQTLHFLCVTCNIAICSVCKLSDHEGHVTKGLLQAVSDARDHVQQAISGRLQNHANCLTSYMREMSDNRQQVQAMRQAVEDTIRARHAELVSLVDDCRDSALLELDAFHVEIDCQLQHDVTCLEKELAVVSGLHQQAEEILNVLDDHQAVFYLERSLEADWGLQLITEKQVKIVPVCTFALEHEIVSVDKDLQTDDADVDTLFCGTQKKNIKGHMQSYIGRTTKKQTPIQKSTPGVKVTPAFCCSDDPDAYVVSVCPTGDGKLAVSFKTQISDVSGLSGHTKSFYEDGRPSKSFDFGLCTLYRSDLKGTYHYLQVKGKNWLWQNETKLFSKAGKKHILVFNCTGQLCVVLPIKGLDFRLIPRPVFLLTDFKSLVSFHETQQPVSFDVSQNGERFALIQRSQGYKEKESEGALGVRLYLRGTMSEGSQEAVDVLFIGPEYDPPVTDFLPSDLCFYSLQGKEVLLVTDYTNHTIHVATVDHEMNSCRFDRFLVSGDRHMRHPTALNTDEAGRLWVACKGGQLLIVEPST